MSSFTKIAAQHEGRDMPHAANLALHYREASHVNDIYTGNQANITKSRITAWRNLNICKHLTYFVSPHFRVSYGNSAVTKRAKIWPIEWDTLPETFTITSRQEYERNPWIYERKNSTCILYSYLCKGINSSSHQNTGFQDRRHPSDNEALFKMSMNSPDQWKSLEYGSNQREQRTLQLKNVWSECGILSALLKLEFPEHVITCTWS